MLTNAVAALAQVNAIIEYSKDNGISWKSVNEELIKKFYTTIGYSGRNEQLLSDPVNYAAYRSLKSLYSSMKFANLQAVGPNWKLPLVRLRESTDDAGLADGITTDALTVQHDIFDYHYLMNKKFPDEGTKYDEMNHLIEICKDGDTYVLSPVDPLPDVGRVYKTFRVMGINAMETTSNQYLGHEARLLQTYLLALTNHSQIATIQSVDIDVYEYDSRVAGHDAHQLSSSYVVRSVIDPGYPSNIGKAEYQNGYVIYKTKVNFGAVNTPDYIVVDMPGPAEDFEVYGRVLRFQTLPFKVNIYKVGIDGVRILVSANEQNMSRILLHLGLCTPYLKSNVIDSPYKTEFGQFHLSGGYGLGVYSKHVNLAKMLLEINLSNAPNTQAQLTTLMRSELSYYGAHIRATQTP